MAKVHMKLRRRAPNARHNPTAGVVIVYDAVKDILVVAIGVDVAVFGVEVSRLTVGKVIVGMGAGEAKR